MSSFEMNELKFILATEFSYHITTFVNLNFETKQTVFVLCVHFLFYTYLIFLNLRFHRRLARWRQTSELPQNMRRHEANQQCPICLESFDDDGDGAACAILSALHFDCGHRACLPCVTTSLKVLQAEQATISPNTESNGRRWPPGSTGQFQAGALVATHGLLTTEYNGRRGRVRLPLHDTCRAPPNPIPRLADHDGGARAGYVDTHGRRHCVARHRGRRRRPRPPPKPDACQRRPRRLGPRPAAQPKSSALS